MVLNMCKTWIVDETEVYNNFTKSVLLSSKGKNDIIENIESYKALENLNKNIYPNILILDIELVKNVNFKKLIEKAKQFGTRIIITTSKNITYNSIPILKKPILISKLLKVYSESKK